MSRQGQRTRAPDPGSQRIYELEVSIFGGPVTKDFAKAKPVVSRTTQIRGDRTPEELHHAIFDAFDRDDEHMYGFEVGGKGPTDPKAKHHAVPGAFKKPIPGSRKSAGIVTQTAIGPGPEGGLGVRLLVRLR